MLIRVFSGRARPGREEELRAYTRDVALPEFRSAPGLIAAHLGTAVDDPTGCIVVTMWEDLDSLIAFTGPDWQQVMTSPDERQMLGTGTVTHFVLDDDGMTPLLETGRNGRTLRPRHHAGAARALIFAGPDTDVTGIARSLKRRGFPALIAPALASAAGLLTRWRPDVAIVGADAPGASKLLAQLERIEVPVLLVGDGRSLGGSANIKAAVLSPAEADEIASAVEIVIGRPLLQGMPELLDAGPIRIDIAERIAFVDDVPVELPPKEFALLAELALHPGQPIPSAEIANAGVARERMDHGRRCQANGLPVTEVDRRRRSDLPVDPQPPGLRIRARASGCLPVLLGSVVTGDRMFDRDRERLLVVPPRRQVVVLARRG